MNIVLTGFKNSGKTTIGKALAKVLNWDFIDVDELIVEYHHRKTGKRQTIPIIYTFYGQAYFRNLEQLIVNNVSDFDKVVIATGGGTILNPTNVINLKKCGKIFYLSTDANDLIERNKKYGHGVFVNTLSPRKSFLTIYKQRKPIYESTSDVLVPVFHRSIDEIVNIIKHEVKNNQYG